MRPERNALTGERGLAAAIHGARKALKLRGVAYSLYYWPLDVERRQLPTAVGTAKTYLLLAAAAMALLFANVSASPPST